MTEPASSVETGVTIPEAMEASGATWRQVHYWISQGWLKSSRGGGWTHLLSPDEVSVARIMVNLIGSGFTAKRASVLARRIDFAERYGEIRLSDTVTMIYDDARGSDGVEGG